MGTTNDLGGMVVGVGSMSGETGMGSCHWCGRRLDGGLCPHCDRRGDGWLARTEALVRLHDGFWLPALAVLAVALAIGVIVVAFVRVEPRATGPSGTEPGSPSPTSPSTPVRKDALGASTFWVLGPDRDETGRRSRLGYAFVIRAGAESSDLLTDYGLVVGRYTRGDRTVDLGHGERTFTATIVAVSPDPHVALLRIGGRFPALPVAATAPGVGDTVVLGEDGGVPAPRAVVVSHSLPGRPHHLTFSVALDGGDDGTPVLNLTGRVVGIAEPSAPFGTGDLGFAVPIRAGCMAVEAC